jgi:hypothetical protein
VTVTGNWFTHPVEPLSNGRGDHVETDLSQREVSLRTAPEWKPSNWLIKSNSFDHGVSMDNSEARPQYTNVVVSDNFLGRGSYCPPGVAFEGNIFEGRPCGQAPVPVAFGYKLADDRLLLEPRKAVTVRASYAAAAKGMSPQEISRALRRSKLINRNAHWVTRILTNDFYLGSQVGPKGAHPAMVTRAVWLRAQRVVPSS